MTQNLGQGARQAVTNMLAGHISASVPRYTSYPTAPHFHEGVGEADYQDWLAKVSDAEPLSVYAHIPFCDRLCWFCGCTTKQINRYDPIPVYLSALHKEIALVHDTIGAVPKIGRLHLGGGSPSLLRGDDLLRMREILDRHFQITAETEISLEIDPSDMGPDGFSAFRQFGMTRASIGVQDFNKEVQRAINRPQSFEQTAAIVDALRHEGVSSLNIDALYGLPLQTVDSVVRSIEQVASLTPDRIALFGYAHVPWIKKHQRLIRDESLPDREERMRQAGAAEAVLLERGYVKIGIDHFALPEDSLALAAESGTMRRNFQGYTTDECQTLIGLGTSSIGKLQQGYLQNETSTGAYLRKISTGNLPIARGFALTDDDRLHADVIEQLMCRFGFSLTALESNHGHRVGSIAQRIADQLHRDEACLISFDGDNFSINPDARIYTRVIASWFDARLQETKTRYSLAV